MSKKDKEKEPVSQQETPQAPQEEAVSQAGTADAPDSAQLTAALESAEKAMAALKEKEAAPAEGAEEIEALIAQRAQAKKEKNWAQADAIRDQLKAMGVEIKDTPNGVEWKRI